IQKLPYCSRFWAWRVEIVKRNEFIWLSVAHAELMVKIIKALDFWQIWLYNKKSSQLPRI
ncbi:hypothetical protein, partial [uncultured Moraxella sp.]|uniref:hypothetical protein n=1 Tax=uncultured Moraxella sp. TaxID=263769 RepID=UPI0025E826B4